MIDTGRREVIGSVSVGIRQFDVVVSADGTEVYAINHDSFDVTVSSVGIMFAPHHQPAADELVRVTASGGRIGLIPYEAALAAEPMGGEYRPGGLGIAVSPDGDRVYVGVTTRFPEPGCSR